MNDTSKEASDHTGLLEEIEDGVSILLGRGKHDRETIVDFVKMVVSGLGRDIVVSEQDIQNITGKLESHFDISMEVGTLLSAEGHTPWLDDARKNIEDWYYWERYKRLLSRKKFNREVVNVLDIDTNKILDHLENPGKGGGWSRKGLCVGHVQSGKTANYLGVICKAADVGYKVIIVLAGLLNALRNQTQERIDEGFVGLDSSRQLDSISMLEKLIGVGKIHTFDSETWRSPVPLTTSTQDFDKQFATRSRAQIGHYNEPVVFVLKKNVSILKNLIDWLQSNNLKLNRFPMLLIDDEADHASVNTNKEDDDPTATNRRIRELLGLFDQSSYLGYTATPFANIFIDPESDDDMLSDDLFPEDFIISLDTPSNYIGARRVFEEEGDLDIVREVDDYDDVLPLKHKKDELPVALPPSLLEAVRTFVLVKAMRNLRGQETSHNSMLINISRFTDIQSNVKWQIHEYLTELRDSIRNHYALSVDEAMSNTNLASLRATWEKEFSGIEFIWDDIQKELSHAVSPIRVIEVNGSKNSESLDYNKHDYPNGRAVIAVGGLSLSRGLTLEGLTVSYFLRNSIMYDTLMQMGRWFGYRPDFEDLCRIYMSEEANSWYAHISRVTEELREEFRRMEKAKMTPKDFGLCVRSHPETLIVTARNKMRTGRSVIRQVNLEGRLVETSVLLKAPAIVADNLNCLHKFVRDISGTPFETSNHPGFFYRNVPVSGILQFIESYNNHPASQLTESKAIIDYAEWLQGKGVCDWDVIIISLSQKRSNNLQLKLPDFTITSQRRTVSDYPGNGIVLKKRRLASRGHEIAGLTEQEIAEAKFDYKSDNPNARNFPDGIYRMKRKKPLLMLHVLDCRKKELPEETLFTDGIVAYGIGFPGETGDRRPEKHVQYVVNTVWWNENYADLLDEEEDIIE